MDHHLDHMIARVLTKNGSSDDFLLLSEWLQADEKNKEEFRLLKSYWDADVSFRHTLEPAFSMEKLRKKIDRQEKRRAGRRIRVVLFSMAAAVALCILFFSTIYLPSRRPAVQQLYTYVTNKNKSGFTLDDGTKIVLNRNSRLTYSDAYGTDKRKVELEGEAYFEVAENPDKPFIVDMGNASVRVLGTTFSVKTDKEHDQITAILLEGSIRFESATQQVLLAPDQQLTFTRSTHRISVQPVDAGDKLAWKDGLLKYKSVALRVLLQELEKRYDATIQIQNLRLADPKVTVSGTFTEEQSLEEILQVISRSLPIRWTELDGTYYVR